MSATLEDLRAGGGRKGDLAVVADLLDSLAAYEHAAGSCAGAMIAEGAPADAIAAALTSLDIVEATRSVMTRSQGDDSRLERQLLEATITACQRSESQCSARAHQHDHCRLHAEAARDAIKHCREMLQTP
jgi:hypothetical protein